jgi:UDP-sugar diphosphatase
MSNEIGNFSIDKLEKSAYIRPYKINFKQNNIDRAWDAILSHDSVSVLIYDIEREVIILVKQFRPVVYISQIMEMQPNKKVEELDFNSHDPNAGFTYELCSGLVDKDGKNWLEITQEEIMEECGYHVPLENIHRVNSFRAGVGISGSKHSTYYAEVTPAMKVTNGGGNHYEGEFIEIFELHKNDIKSFMNDETKEKPAGLLYSLIWFLYEREEFLKGLKK